MEGWNNNRVWYDPIWNKWLLGRELVAQLPRLILSAKCSCFPSAASNMSPALRDEKLFSLPYCYCQALCSDTLSRRSLALTFLPLDLVVVVAASATASHNWLQNLSYFFSSVNELVASDAVLCSIMHEWYSSTDNRRSPSRLVPVDAAVAAVIESCLHRRVLFFRSSSSYSHDVIAEKFTFLLFLLGTFLGINLLTFLKMKCQCHYAFCHRSALEYRSIQRKNKNVIAGRWETR